MNQPVACKTCTLIHANKYFIMGKGGEKTRSSEAFNLLENYGHKFRMNVKNHDKMIQLRDTMGLLGN